jgi:hypothetical protein
MTKASSKMKVPTAIFVRCRHLHVPRSYEVAQRLLDSLPDDEDHRRVGDVLNLNVDRVHDEHGRPKDASAVLCNLRSEPGCCQVFAPSMSSRR